MAEETKKIIYSMLGVSKRHGTKKVLEDISLSYFLGAKIGVLGLNGSGKSSLLRILSGDDTDFDGETSISKGFTIGYLEQEPLQNETRTVREVLEEGVSEIMNLLKEYDQINEKFAAPMSEEEMDALLERQGAVQDLLENKGGWDIDSRLEMAADALRCPPGETSLSVVSGGEKRRVALCKLLLSKPDILLLDEPTNHLDAESVSWLEHHLKQYEGTIIAVTHDRYFLDNVAGWILELDRGMGIPWKGNYSSWLEQKQARLRLEKKQETKRIKTLERELEWIRMTPKAKQTRSKSRIKSYESLLSQNTTDMEKDLQIFIPPGPRLGDRVISAQNLSKSFDDNILFDDLTFEMPPGAVLGIIGPNGAGKTTLFRMITGEETPDSGSFTLGETVKYAYASQMREAVSDDKTIWEVISDDSDILRIGNREVNSRAYVSQFNFTGADQQKLCGNLSGGERNRVNLALTVKKEANLLLLDEPTNDLDINTVRALEEGIMNFAGSVMVISHDRWFLDRVCTHILAFEDDGTQEWFIGNFSEYKADRMKRLDLDSEQPKRLKYRHLTRG